jgi:hypothetical protein
MEARFSIGPGCRSAIGAGREVLLKEMALVGSRCDRLERRLDQLPGCGRSGWRLGGPVNFCFRWRPGGGVGERLLSRLILLIAVLSYLDRLLDPLTDTLTPESAAALLSLRADADVEARVDELRRKASEGALTPAEDAEYENFIEAVDVVSIMQAKARRFLSRQAA